MENGMRILGLDFGSKTVGVAVTDPLGYTAQGVEIIRRDSPNKLCAKLYYGLENANPLNKPES